MRDKMVNILLAYAKEKQIPGSRVIFELLVDELMKHGAIIPINCHDCSHRNDDGHCFKDIATPGYKKTHIFGYCDKGEKQ